MTFEKWTSLNNEYRMICEWDESLTLCDKESLFIPCYENKGMIYWIDNKKIGIIIFNSPFNILSNLKAKYNLELESFGELSNYFIEISDNNNLNEILDMFKAKKQAKRPIPPHSIRNLTTFLRVMQNVHPRYKTLLDEYIKSRKEMIGS